MNNYVRIKNLCKIVSSPVGRFQGLKKYISTGNINDIDKGDLVSYDNRPSRANLIVDTNDIIIAKMKNANKTTFIDTTLKDNIYSTGFMALRAHNVNPRYFYYLLQCDEFISQKNLYSLGITQCAINNDKFKEIKVHFIEDKIIQKKIVDYLDKKCSKIDDIIEGNKKEIEYLNEYKNSIVDFSCLNGIRNHHFVKSNHYSIDKYPDNWKFTKTLFGLAMPITDGPHETPNLISDGIPFISADAIKNGKIDFSRKRGYISKEDHEKFCLKYKPKINDIYMIKSGATTGKVGIVDTTETFNIWSPLGVFRVDPEKLNFKFLYYLLQTNFYQKQVQLNWSFGTQQNIGMRTLENLKILIPPLDEQEEIVLHLDKQCSKLDKIIEYRRQIIEKLIEYRKSIIYEVVTGKRKV